MYILSLGGMREHWTLSNSFCFVGLLCFAMLCSILVKTYIYIYIYNINNKLSNDPV